MTENAFMILSIYLMCNYYNVKFLSTQQFSDESYLVYIQWATFLLNVLIVISLIQASAMLSLYIAILRYPHHFKILIIFINFK